MSLRGLLRWIKGDVGDVIDGLAGVTCGTATVPALPG